MRTRLVALAVATLVGVGCVLPPAALPGGRPTDTVRFAMDRLAEHDIAGTATVVCPEQWGGWLPFSIPGMFTPTGPYDTGTLEETLALYDYDTSEVVLTETGVGGVGRVAITGTLIARLDADEVEALIRARAAISGDVVDEAGLAVSLDEMRAGPNRIPVDEETVNLQQVGDTWQICGPFPSAAPSAAE